jgi:hypothetical protein
MIGRGPGVIRRHLAAEGVSEVAVTWGDNVGGITEYPADELRRDLDNFISPQKTPFKANMVSKATS